MMKSMNDEVHNWLGFSLSPQLKMEANPPSDNPPPPASGSFYSYGLSENGDFQSPSSIMPLKSDASLCILEAALSTSHTQGVVPNSSPKLEDFLGGATMATHQFQIMDSTFYKYYYSGLNCNNNGIFQTTTNDEQQQQSVTHQIPQISEDVMKTWMDHQNNQMSNNNNNNNNISVNTSMGCGDLQSLSLSMSPGSQSSCVTRQISPIESVAAVMETKKRGSEKLGHKPTVHRKSIDTFGQRTSQYRGVTRHRWTGRYEAHLWDNSCKKEGQTRKGRQVYLGGYDKEEKAARAYDLAALKYWGPSTHINFGLENYHQELEEMQNMSRQEYVAHLRRKSSGFSRGASIYRGVTRHHQHGRWQARIGRVAGNKDLYLGTFSTQEEAAEAYDIAAIKFRGANAVTNFDISRYDVEKIMASNTLPTGEIVRRNKEADKLEAETGICCYNTLSVENVPNAHWKMVLQNQENAEAELLNVKAMNVGHYQQGTFSVALHEHVGVEPSHALVDESNTVAQQQQQHFSNASSLVTSLSSSREASPEKYGAPILFAKPSTTSSAWTPTPQPRPVPLTTAHLPVFTAWSDI